MRVYLILLVVLFSSCKVTKFIDREKIVVDSSAVEQKDLLERTLKETIESHAKEKEQWEQTGVVFETTPCPDSTKTVTKIIYDNGKLKSIEGNVRSLNQSLYQRSSELSNAYTTIDSLRNELAKKETQLSKQTVIVKKEIKKVSFIPWWVWLIVGGSLIAGTLFPTAKRFLKQKLNI